MTKAYLVGIIWADQSEFFTYRQKESRLLEKHGGRYLVVGGDPAVVQGDQCPRSVVVIEFPSRDAAKAFYNDPDYASLQLTVPQLDPDVHFVLVDGVES